MEGGGVKAEGPEKKTAAIIPSLGGRNGVKKRGDIGEIGRSRIGRGKKQKRWKLNTQKGAFKVAGVAVRKTVLKKVADPARKMEAGGEARGTWGKDSRKKSQTRVMK